MVKKLSLAILIFITIVLRFTQLGYSHFYGDETKTFYLNKTVSATNFLLNQRKGPVQFIVVWAVEKIINGHSEFMTRLPFAIAGTLSVVFFYLYLNKKYSASYPYVPLLATYLFSLSGFFIAFSRTAQYQSFLILFGLMALSTWEYKKPFVAGIFMGLAFLCHYDAVFFVIPILVDIFKNLNKKVLIQFLTPLILVSGIFYVPYLIYGDFLSSTMPYIFNRVRGDKLLPSSSLRTFLIYNPSITTALVLIPSVVPILLGSAALSLILWFIVPFILFEFIFSNPGTHIYNYLIPLIILAALGFQLLFNMMKSRLSRGITVVTTCLLLLTITNYAFKTYIPIFNSGYPWNANIYKKDFQFFLYGFPYRPGWDEVRSYIKSQGGAENFYTNDNVTLAAYYLYPAPSYKYHPVYYVYVVNNQEYKPLKFEIFRVFNYSKVKDMYVDGKLSISIYKREDRRPRPLWDQQPEQYE